MDKRTGNRYGWYAARGGNVQHLWYNRDDMDLCLALCGAIANVDELVWNPELPHCGACRMLAAFGPSFGLLAEVS